MEYCIVTSFGTAAEFTDAVNERIACGWTPQGGVFCVVEGGMVMGYMQAMIRMQPLTQQVDIRGWDNVTVPLFNEVKR